MMKGLEWFGETLSLIHMENGDFIIKFKNGKTVLADKREIQELGVLIPAALINFRGEL